MSITKDFTPALEIVCQKKSSAGDNSVECFMRAAGNAGLSRPVNNRRRQPPGRKKRARLGGANGHRQFAELDCFISVRNSAGQLGLVRPNLRVPESKHR